MRETQNKHAHFIGLCGVGMSAVAKLLKDNGWSISGSDAGVYPPISDYLEQHNLPCATGYSSENIPENTHLIVIGKNAKLVPETNDEVRDAYTSGVDVKSFPEVLNELTKQTHNILCVGSHGKSSCTALMTWCLVHAEKDPSFFIGAVPTNLTVSSQIGTSGTFVLEGDEYPSSNTDPSSKFLHYNPHDILLTSAEHDHINIFKTQEDYLKPFHELLSKIPSDGLLVVHGDEQHAQKLLQTYEGSYVTYSNTENHDWGAKNICYGEQTTFTLIHNGADIVELTTSLLGAHNVENIVGVTAMLLEKGLLTPAQVQSGVETFKGIVRRLDRKTVNSSVPVYEGFGSSYTKARAAIDAIKLHFPKKRLIVVFEPHTFSWRNKDYIHHYDTIFNGVDIVLVYKPPTQGSTTHNQSSHKEIVDRIASSGTNVHAITNESEGLTMIESIAKADDVVLLLTSGGLDGMVQSIPAFFENNFGSK